MGRLPPRSTRNVTLFPDTTLFLSVDGERIHPPRSEIILVDSEPGATVAVADHARLARLRRRGPAQPGPAVGDVHAGGAVMFLELGVEHLAGQRDAGIDLPLHRARQPEPIALHLAMESVVARSEEHTSELKSLMRISYAVFCLKKK